MHMLITGGAGFIGSHLAEALLAYGHRVAIIDDLSTGSVQNIRPLKNNPNFSYTIGSLENRQLLAELVDDAEQIYHLAAAVGVELIVESPVRTIETNINGTEAVLSLAAKKRKKVLVTSTSEVYGKSNDIPFREDGDLVLGATTKGRWSYACSKAIDEFLAIAYYRERRVPVVICRLFNTVGPRQTGRYGMVIPRFVQQALQHRPITVYGSGEQSRCFTHVTDVVEAMIRLMAHEDAVGEVFNIGSQEEVTIRQLAERISTRSDSRSPIIHIPYDQAYQSGFEDMMRRVPSLDKIKRLIAYSPARGLDEIIDSVIEFYLGSESIEQYRKVGTSA